MNNLNLDICPKCGTTHNPYRRDRTKLEYPINPEIWYCRPCNIEWGNFGIRDRLLTTVRWSDREKLLGKPLDTDIYLIVDSVPERVLICTLITVFDENNKRMPHNFELIPGRWRLMYNGMGLEPIIVFSDGWQRWDEYKLPPERYYRIITQ